MLTAIFFTTPLLNTIKESDVVPDCTPVNFNVLVEEVPMVVAEERLPPSATLLDDRFTPLPAVYVGTAVLTAIFFTTPLLNNIKESEVVPACTPVNFNVFVEEVPIVVAAERLPPSFTPLLDIVTPLLPV